MKIHPSFRPKLDFLAVSAAFAVTTLALAPALRAQSPSPAPGEHDATSDIFEVIKKGADKLQKQAKEAGKIEPQLKALEDRQAEYIKHQEEVEHALEEVLLKQSAEIHALTQAVERLQAEVKATHSAFRPLPRPAPSAAPEAPAAPAAPLPATEPAAPTPAPTQS